MSLYNSLKILYDKYPRQAGIPNRVDMHSFDELLHFINLYNGSERVYVSVLPYTFKNKFPIIDRILFDLDNSDDMIGDIRKFFTWLQEHHYKSTVIFSGGGFHFYLFAKPTTTSKFALANFQRKAAKETKIPFDSVVYGDTARIAGVPGSYNTKRGRYVCFLSQDDIFHEDGMKHIYEKAHNQFSEISIYGDELVDLAPFARYEPPQFDMTTISPLDFNGDGFLSTVPPCIGVMLNKGNLDHNERGFVLNYLITRGFNRETIVSILKKYLSEDKFNHCVGKESQMFNGKKGENQLEYLMRKYLHDSDWRFNSCLNIQQHGWCVKPCCGKHPYEKHIKG